MSETLPLKRKRNRYGETLVRSHGRFLPSILWRRFRHPVCGRLLIMRWYRGRWRLTIRATLDNKPELITSWHVPGEDGN